MNILLPEIRRVLIALLKHSPLQLKLLNDDEDMTLIDLLDCVFNSTLPLTAAVFKNAPTVLVCGNEVDNASRSKR